MEVIYAGTQTVNGNQNVIFNDTVVGCQSCLMHREGSGLVTLRGATNSQPRARYRITFGANIGVPTGGTLAPVSLALAINGEGVQSTTMTTTPGAVGDLNNVASSTFIDVPRGCCFEIAVKNILADPIVVDNANLIVERTA